MRRVKSAPANLAAMAHRKVKPLKNECTTLARAEAVKMFEDVTSATMPESIHVPLTAVVSHVICDDECNIEFDPRVVFCLFVRLLVRFFGTLLLHQVAHWSLTHAQDAATQLLK